MLYACHYRLCFDSFAAADMPIRPVDDADFISARLIFWFSADDD